MENVRRGCIAHGLGGAFRHGAVAVGAFLRHDQAEGGVPGGLTHALGSFLWTVRDVMGGDVALRDAGELPAHLFRQEVQFDPQQRLLVLRHDHRGGPDHVVEYAVGVQPVGAPIGVEDRFAGQVVLDGVGGTGGPRRRVPGEVLADAPHEPVNGHDDGGVHVPVVRLPPPVVSHRAPPPERRRWTATR